MGSVDIHFTISPIMIMILVLIQQIKKNVHIINKSIKKQK